MQDILIPKNKREKLDELEIGGSLPIVDESETHLDFEKERRKFQTEMNRSFHAVDGNKKVFSIRQGRVYRLADIK